MRGLVRLLAVTVAMVLLLGGALAAMRLGTAPAVAQESLTLVEHASNETVVDLADEGDSVGDTLVFSNELYDADDAEEVGSTQGSCVRTVVGEAWECTWTNTLADGAIVVQGQFLDSGEGHFAITGGTGKYSGATGEMTLTAAETSTAESPKWKFEFEIN